MSKHGGELKTVATAHLFGVAPMGGLSIIWPRGDFPKQRAITVARFLSYLGRRSRLRRAGCRLDLAAKFDFELCKNCRCVPSFDDVTD